MNEQQLAAVKQALEALMVFRYAPPAQRPLVLKAIADLEQVIAQDALYKMAEDAVTIGLSYNDWPKIGCVNHDCDQCKAVQEPVIDHSCKDTYELIMKWADIYAAQTGNLYAQAAQDPSKVARMADERTMLACVVAQAISQPPEPDLLSALKRILDEPNNTMSDGKALKEIIRIARRAITKATGEKT